MKLHKNSLLISLGIFVGFLLLYSFKLPQSLVYEMDFARDVTDILKIARGNLAFLGPKSSFGGLYSPPYYYYLFAPLFRIAGFSFNGILYFHTFLFAGTLSFVSYILSRRYSLLESTLATVAVGLSPLYIFAARNPSNTFTYLFLLLTLLFFIFTEKLNKRVMLGLGFLAGVGLTFDYVALILFIPLLIWIYTKLKIKKYVFLFLGGFLVSLAPLMVFEVTHGFILFRNTFIEQSYLSFVNDSNTHSGMQRGFVDNVLFVSNVMRNHIVIPGIFYFLINALLLIFIKNKKSQFLLGLSFFTFLFLALVLRFQYAEHYVVPVSFFILVATVLIFLKSKKTALLLALVGLELLFFPKHYFAKSWRPYQPYEQAVQYAINDNLVKSPFNIIQVRPDTTSAASGFEYRYFFEKANIVPNSIYEYKSANTLLVFSEDPTFDINTLNNWEISEFGKEYLTTASSYTIGSINLYLLAK